MSILNLKNSYEYYRAHESEYPVDFLLKNDDWDDPAEREYLTINNKVTGEWIATLEYSGSYYIAYADTFDLGETSNPPRCYLDLTLDCKEYQFDYDLNTPEGVLSAFIDCVYLKMAYVKKKMSEFMDQIDRGD